MSTVDSRANLTALKKFTSRVLVGDENSEEELRSLMLLLAVERCAKKQRLHWLPKSEGLSSDISMWTLDQVRRGILRLAQIADAAIPSWEPSEVNPSDQFLKLAVAACLSARSVLHLFDERLLGYVYQIATADARQSAQQAIQTSNKRTAKADLIAFTKLYTPDWVVDFLLANTVLPQLKDNASSLSIFAVELETRGTENLQDLRIMDPACGSGHFLIRTFKFIVEQLTKSGASSKEAARKALASIAGTDIDSLGLWVCRLSLTIQALCEGLDANDVCIRLEDVSPYGDLGSLIKNVSKDSLLARQYHAIVTNPPYIGRRLIDRNLKGLLKKAYPNACGDLSAAFLERCMQLLAPSGRVGMITQSSCLYLPTYKQLRQSILEDYHVVCGVETGPRVFPLINGEKVDNVLLVIARDSVKAESLFVDLRLANEKSRELINVLSGVELRASAEGRTLFRIQAGEFRDYRHCAFNYRCPPFLSRIINHATKLSSICEIRQGLATTDNARFVRKWRDVEPEEIGKRWHPYVKGAGAERWFAPIEFVVDWENNGEAIKAAVAQKYPYLAGKTNWVVKNEQCYFRPGLTFSFVNSGAFAARVLPAGCIFDVGGSAIFPPEEERFLWLAYLNSSFISLCAQIMNPTINMQVGDLKDLPLLEFSSMERKTMQDLARKCIELATALGAAGGNDVFHRTPSANDNARTQESWRNLASLETEIDQLVLHTVSRQFSLAPEEDKLLEELCSSRADSRTTSVKFAVTRDLKTVTPT